MLLLWVQAKSAVQSEWVRTRSANAYHSAVGLTAMLAQEVRAFHDARHSP